MEDGGFKDDHQRFAAWVGGSNTRDVFGGHGSMLAKLPEPNPYTALLAEAAEAVVSIKRRVWGLEGEGKKETTNVDAGMMWSRLFNSGHMLKEMSECLPVVARFLAWLEGLGPEGAPVTVVDLCSGVGYLSMLLSEIVCGRERKAVSRSTSAEQRSTLRSIARFVLIDKAFPMQGSDTKVQHINPDHLRQPNLFAHDFSFRKYDIQSSSGHRQLSEHVVNSAPGSVALLGVRLCGVLAINAVRMYNDHPRAAFLALKPCCLPPVALAKDEKSWHVGGHCICAEDVCGPTTRGRREFQKGTCKEQRCRVFGHWVKELLLCVECEGDSSGAQKDILDVQDHAPDENDHQTQTIFASREYRPECGVVSSIHAKQPSTETASSPLVTASKGIPVFPLDPKRDVYGLGAGDSFLLAGFLTELDADAAYQALLPLDLGGDGEARWVQMYGPDKRLLPRLQNVMADQDQHDGIPIYRFPSNNQNACTTEPWSETVARLRDVCLKKVGGPLNHSVGNLYRNEHDFIGAHRDKMLDIAEGSNIFTVSLGAERPMVIRCLRNSVEQVVPLRHGSCFVIGPETNRLWSHSLPQQKQSLGPRISLTIRQMGSFHNLLANSIVGQGSRYQDKNWPMWEHDLRMVAKVPYPRRMRLTRVLFSEHCEEGSTFGCRIVPCTTLAGVDQHWREIREQFPNACCIPYAWIICPHSNLPIGKGVDAAALQGSEEHGEPKSCCAGILALLGASGLTNCAVFVVRHWDGVHLGLKRLSAAYATTVHLALASLETYSAALPPV